MFIYLLISLDLSDSDIQTTMQTRGTVEDKPLVRNAVVESVINVMDKSAEEQEEDKS